MQAPFMPKFSKGTSDKIIKILAELEEGLHKKIENITIRFFLAVKELKTILLFDGCPLFCPRG